MAKNVILSYIWFGPKWTKFGFIGPTGKKWNVFPKKRFIFLAIDPKKNFPDFAQIFRKVASHIDKCEDSLFAGKYQTVRKLGPKYCGSRPKKETCFDTFCFLGSPTVNPLKLLKFSIFLTAQTLSVISVTRRIFLESYSEFKGRPSSTAGDFGSPSYGRKITNFGAGRNSGPIFGEFTAFFGIFTTVLTAGFASQALITARCIFPAVATARAYYGGRVQGQQNWKLTVT